MATDPTSGPDDGGVLRKDDEGVGCFVLPLLGLGGGVVGAGAGIFSGQMWLLAALTGILVGVVFGGGFFTLSIVSEKFDLPAGAARACRAYLVVAMLGAAVLGFFGFPDDVWNPHWATEWHKAVAVWLLVPIAAFAASIFLAQQRALGDAIGRASWVGPWGIVVLGVIFVMLPLVWAVRFLTSG